MENMHIQQYRRHLKDFHMDEDRACMQANPLAQIQHSLSIYI